MDGVRNDVLPASNHWQWPIDSWRLSCDDQTGGVVPHTLSFSYESVTYNGTGFGAQTMRYYSKCDGR